MRYATMLLLAAAVSAGCAAAQEGGSTAAGAIRAAVVTGGHGFEEAPFFEVFRGHPDIHFKQLDEGSAFEDISQWPYDVIVMYNMSGGISETGRGNLMALLERGVGLVSMHHAIANYPDWPRYRDLIGAAYFRKPTEMDGKEYPRSEYTHDVDCEVEVVDKEHPITKGLEDFTIHDEVYRKWVAWPDNHVLLRTKHPESHEQIAWVRPYDDMRVCYIQLGHGPEAYANPSFRKLVAQAIRWADERPPEPAAEGAEAN